MKSLRNKLVAKLLILSFLSACGQQAANSTGAVSEENVGSGVSALFGGMGSQAAANSLPKRVLDRFVKQAIADAEEANGTCDNIEGDSERNDNKITFGASLASITTEESILLGKDQVEFVEADFCQDSEGNDQLGAHTDGGDRYATYDIESVEMDCVEENGETFVLNMVDGKGAWRQKYDGSPEERNDGVEIKGSFTILADDGSLETYTCDITIDHDGEYIEGEEDRSETFTASCKDESGVDVAVDAQATCSAE